MGARWIAALLVAVAAQARADEGDLRLAADTLVYTDDDSVQIVTPQASARLRLDEDGSEAGVRVALDVISAASVDVTSHATTRFSEERLDANVDLARQLGAHRPSLTYHLSWEPDYVSQGVGVGLESQLAGSDSVLALGWTTLFDTVGVAQTPRADFSESLVVSTGVVSFTQVLDPHTVVRGTVTLGRRDGYQEKPYRFVPLFDAAGVRLPARPPESVPEARTGIALGVRGVRWIDAWRGAVRVDAQIYRDDWEMTSFAIEPALTVHLGEAFLLQGSARLYLQDATFFWQKQYRVEPGTIPRWRSVDRDLSPFWTLSAAVRLEWTSGAWTIYGEPGIGYTRYLDFALLDERTALTGLLGVRCVP
jgi:hypothetical protein